MEVPRRDVEDCLTSIKVLMSPGSLVHISLPTRVIKVSVEGMEPISPCILKSSNMLKVILLPHSYNQILILDGPAILKDYLTLVSINLISGDPFSQSNELPE